MSSDDVDSSAEFALYLFIHLAGTRDSRRRNRRQRDTECEYSRNQYFSGRPWKGTRHEEGAKKTLSKSLKVEKVRSRKKESLSKVTS